ncbi:AAA domain-containing protein [Viscerimonas tarda]
MNYQIIIKGEDKTNSVKNWQQFGDKVEITFCNSEKKYSYREQDVKIILSALLKESAKQRFEYLKRIATAVSLKNESIGNILANQYDKIDFVSSESVLSDFLTEKLSYYNKQYLSNAVYPFGFNESQKNAVEKALTNKLSIIEGPPGTGKTQTILNIIANAIIRGESVAVVSSNNSATKNVLEKLEKYKVDFIAAYLGSRENKQAFIDEQKNKSFPTFAEWELSAEEKNEVDIELKSLFEKLNKKLQRKNELSHLKQELDGIELEYKYFENNFQNNDSNLFAHFFGNKNSDTILEIWLYLENYKFIDKYHKTNGLQKWIKRLKFYIKYGIVDKSVFFISEEADALHYCRKHFYNSKTAEIKNAINTLEKELNDFDFDRKMKEYSELSLLIFRDKLARKYERKERTLFEIDELWKNSEKFIEEYPVVLSTTYSLRSSLSNKIMYDYVIVDEASQVNLATGALALSCAKKAVIVGDLKQLPNVVNSEDAEKTDKFFAEYNLPEYYHYKNHSILLSLTEMFPNAPRTLLREHYRCHPKIIDFCNQKFYNNQLIILSEAKSKRSPLIVYKTVEGSHERNRINQRQIDVIKNEIIPQQNLDKDVSLGIVTPYRNQTNALRQAFAGTNIQADTVDKFQGRENDVIVLSTVDNEISEFADNANRLNVAVSRAKDQLIVVVNGNDMTQDTNIGDLVKYVEYNNLEIVQSEISSVFDLLFKCHNEKRLQYLENKKIVSEYDSENLLFNEIDEILQEKDFQKFGVKIHIPMRMVLHNTDNLNDEEAKYALNELTHFDFLIFDKISKLPRLVIEVDGVAFHKKGTPQSRRDDLKNSILEKINLPYIRLGTSGSLEKEQIKKKLQILKIQY